MPEASRATSASADLAESGEEVLLSFDGHGEKQQVIISTHALASFLEELLTAYTDPRTLSHLRAFQRPLGSPHKIIVLPTEQPETGSEPFGSEINVWFYVRGGLRLGFRLMPRKAEELASRISTAARRVHDQESR
jgi:hypothetical protein